MDIGSQASGMLSIAGKGIILALKIQSGATPQEIVAASLDLVNEIMVRIASLREQLGSGVHVPELAELEAKLAQLKALPDLGPAKD